MAIASTIYTIGYGNRGMSAFVALLKRYWIKLLVDVRSFPDSGRPNFKRSNLKMNLSIPGGIDYLWIKELGGKIKHDRTYPLQQLFEAAMTRITAIMCSEMDFRKCHRWEIAKELHKKGAKVAHINKKGKLEFEPCASGVVQHTLIP